MTDPLHTETRPARRPRHTTRAIALATLLALAGTPTLAARDAPVSSVSIQQLFEAERAACEGGRSRAAGGWRVAAAGVLTRTTNPVGPDWNQEWRAT